MMISFTWLFFLACSIVGVTSVSPRAITAWVAPSCSSSGVRSLRTRKQNGRASSSANPAVRDKILGGLHMIWPNGNSNDKIENGVNGNDVPPSNKQQIPFIIQKIGRGKKEEIEEITRMCIDVFFNEQEDAKINEDGIKKQTPPWRALQLAYLGNLQKGDILARNAFKQNDLVDLIVARRVYAVPGTTQINGNIADLVEDPSQIYNMGEADSQNIESGEMIYMTGEIIGYSEVSEKSFGLGAGFDATATTTTIETTSQGKRKKKVGEKPRPYLSNLSVVEYARQSGVGSKLLDACEQTVRDWNAGYTEIVLQVEEDNQTAIQFYKRRGWEYVFADPTCRRFDTSGFFLKESRITKYAMIKRLTNGSENGEGASDAPSFIQKLKNSFFVQ